MRVSVLGISDVSVGYGSPEIVALMHDLAECDWVASARLLEADEPDRPHITGGHFSFELERIGAHGLPPQSLSWTRHTIREAARIANNTRPDVLILFGGAIFPVIALLNYRPRSIVYHAYEQISDLPAETLAAHRVFLREVNLVTTPSIRRLIHDAVFLGMWPRSVCTMFNVADVAYLASDVKVAKPPRQAYLVWCGSLHSQRTFAYHFLSPEISDIRIEMYGRVEDNEHLRAALDLSPNIKHHGIVPANDLHAAVLQAAFSVVWWNPANSYGHLHLASNRFFTAIQMGTPPLCGPHPQCLEIARRFDCAIVMEDWSQESFVSAARRAMDLFGTDAYDVLVERCLDASASGLSWKAQSQRIIAAIRGTL